MVAKLFFSAVLISFFNFESANCDHLKRITVTGKAIDDKGIAVVLTDKGPYFLDRVFWWDEMYLGRQVKVTGILTIVTHEKHSNDSTGLVQERVGTMRILKRPKWSLLQ